MKTYQDLLIWQKGIELVQQVYTFTSQLPSEENFGLRSQMRRAAVAIPSNIAEGYQRGTSKEWRQFLIIAYSSAAELETQTIICGKIYNLRDAQLSDLITQLLRLLNVSIQKSKS